MNLKIKIILLSLLLLLTGCSNNKDISSNESTLPDETKEKIKIVAFGDSLTAGYNLLPEESYPSQLQKILGENGYNNYEIINAGVSGDTSKSALERTDWVLKTKPQIVILAIGANDGLRGLDVQQMEENISAIIEKLQQNKVQIILTGIRIPLNLGPFYTLKFEKVYQNLADKYELPLVPFLLENVAMIPELNLSDGIHPNQAGYQIVAQNVFKILETILEK